MKIDMGDVVGITVAVVIIGVFIGVLKRIDETTEPCYPRNVERRQVWIDSHERCMVEANCIYEDWDIRQYDINIARQAMCEAKGNE